MIFFLSLASKMGECQPHNWWLQNKATLVHSSIEFEELLAGSLKDKFIFIDFYMQYCKWCYFILDDFNKLISDMELWYGTDKVAFLKIDGQIVWEVANKYRVQYFPHFTAIAPDT